MADTPKVSEDFLIQHQRAKETSKQIDDFYARRAQKPLWREYAEVILFALVAAVILRLFVVSAYRVSSGSMEDTLLTGDYIFVNKLAYKYHEPASGDIIVFDYPLNRDKTYIKRLVALPGQTVEVIDKALFVDGEMAEIPTNSKHTDPHVLAADLSARDNFGPVQVPPGNFFVMGDNRDESQDSRFWGFVKAEDIRGKALFIYWSWQESDEEFQWEFPYIHQVLFKAGSVIVGIPSRLRLERLGMTL